MLFQLSRYWLFNKEHANEFIIALVAVVSIVIGIYFGKNRSAPKEVEKIIEAPQQADLSQLEKLNISSREYEVLQLISQGYSNKEIGEKLFVSESTIKTHVSNLLVKLDAKRRTQAVKNAKELKIII